jgi:putative membrane protein
MNIRRVEEHRKTTRSQQKIKARAENFATALRKPSALATLFLVGALGHLLPTRPFFLAITPVFLLVLGVCVLAPLTRERTVLSWLTVVTLATFTLEAIGVATGAIFGSYVYGATLGPKLLGVPVIIALNWAVVIAGSVGLASQFLRKALSHHLHQHAFLTRTLIALTAAGITVLFDMLLEPVAIANGYWIWDGTIPLQNYVAWFVIGLAAALFAPRTLLESAQSKPLRPASHYVLAMAAFLAMLLIGYSILP